MHRKSLEAAEQLKDSETGSDHEDTTSMRTDTSDTSATSSQNHSSNPNSQNQNPMPDSKEQLSISGSGVVTSPPAQSLPQNNYPEDPEVFRNNSIACLRAKAQEHSAKLLNNHNLMVHTGGGRSGSGGCDANQNNLHHQDGGGGEQGIF